MPLATDMRDRVLPRSTTGAGSATHKRVFFDFQIIFEVGTRGASNSNVVCFPQRVSRAKVSEARTHH